MIEIAVLSRNEAITQSHFDGTTRNGVTSEKSSDFKNFLDRANKVATDYSDEPERKVKDKNNDLKNKISSEKANRNSSSKEVGHNEIKEADGNSKAANTVADKKAKSIKKHISKKKLSFGIKTSEKNNQKLKNVKTAKDLDKNKLENNISLKNIINLMFENIDNTDSKTQKNNLSRDKKDDKSQKITSEKEIKTKGKPKSTIIIELKDNRKKTLNKTKVMDINNNKVSMTQDNGSSIVLDENKDTEQIKIVSTSGVKTDNSDITAFQSLGGEKEIVNANSARDALINTLKETGNADIVKQAKILLKDDNNGEINLVLRPRELGRVKISLSMTDGSISGKILVQNMFVKEIFQQNVHDLISNFREQGFSVSQLDVNLEGGNPDGHKGESSNTNGNLFVKEKDKLEQAVPLADVISEKTMSVNLIV